MMGDQIIKQPNGKYLLFSSIEQHVILHDATPNEILKFWLKYEEERITRRLTQILTQLEKGEKPYHQFTKTFEEILSFLEENYGEEDKTLLALKKTKNV